MNEPTQISYVSNGTETGAAPVPFTDLDAMLTPEECATWLRVSVKELKSNKAIRPISLGHKTKRYHPRTVIEQLKQCSNLCLK